MTTQFTRYFYRPVYAAIGSALLMFSYSEKASADAFTNKDLLALPELQRKGYIDGVISTLWQVAALENLETGQCVVDWYYGEKIKERNWLIMRSLEKYPDYRPENILIALTERACGSYLRREG